MAQFPNVPEKVKKELKIKQISVGGYEMSYGISYPENYEENRQYQVLLCLSGGGFSEQLAYYYHHVYSPKGSFKEYLKIYPISPSKKSLLSFSSADWQALIKTIQRNESTTEKNWIISGASNGGLATYDLITASPGTFDGFMTIPGSMSNHELLSEWKNYTVLVAYMSLDRGWISGSKEAYRQLESHVKSIALFEIEGYGHILDETYDIEPLYKKFLSLQKSSKMKYNE